MPAPSPRSTGEHCATGSSRVWPTGAAAFLAVGFLVLSYPSAPDRSPGPAPDLVVDPNTATPGVLAALPRMGPVLLRQLLAARRERPFDSIDDMDRRVRGLGPATLAALRPHLHINPPGPR